MFVQTSDASILHADLDSFYASVEQRDDPSLRGKPVLVGGGVVLAASYEAKAFGVAGAMSGRQARVLDEVGLPISVGIARTKFLAKVASRQAKPDGLLLVPPQTELEFLHPLPVGALWGVGPVTTGKLAERGIHTVGEVATLAPEELTAMLGPAA